MNDNKLLQVVKWLIVVSVFITLLFKAQIFWTFGSWHSDMPGSILVSVFFLGSLGSISGLILKRLWGFISIYALVLVATYLGISLIPFARLFPASSRTISVIILNTILFAATVWLQMNQNKIKHERENSYHKIQQGGTEMARNSIITYWIKMKHTYGVEKPVDTSNRLSLIFPGLLSFIVGLMFFIPGIYFAYTILIKSLLKMELPGLPVTLFILFLMGIGTILLLLSYQFFSGTVGRQHISTPLLIVISTFFIVLSSVLALAAHVFQSLPIGHLTDRAIGAGFGIGGVGLWFAHKRKRGAYNKQMQN